MLMPHPPFVFQADGSDRQTRLPVSLHDGREWRQLARNSGETYEDGYIDAVRFLNSRIDGIVRRVLDRAERPTLFYIQGDHGPGSRFNRDSAEDTDMHERFGILLAMRFPDASPPPIDSHVTPVNAFRLLLNRAIGTRLPLLENRSYFTTWSRPFDFIDVTERLHRVRAEEGVSSDEGGR
jgi:hypothetical protein